MCRAEADAGSIGYGGVAGGDETVAVGGVVEVVDASLGEVAWGMSADKTEQIAGEIQLTAIGGHGAGLAGAVDCLRSETGCRRCTCVCVAVVGGVGGHVVGAGAGAVEGGETGKAVAEDEDDVGWVDVAD